MVKMTALYRGELSCDAHHEPSGENLVTDAPVDIGGNATSFSPTDLIGTALLTCILTTVGSVANKYDLDVKGMKGEVEKVMTETEPRRIAQLNITLEIPLPETHIHREKLERAIHYCPVHHALSADVVKNIVVTWQTSV